MSNKVKNKFILRVWDKISKRYWTKNEVEFYANRILFPDEEFLEQHEIEVSTHLMDDNYVDIYENDIVYSNILDTYYKFKFISDDDHQSFVFEDVDSTEKVCASQKWIFDNNIKVIGNIHKDFTRVDNVYDKYIGYLVKCWDNETEGCWYGKLVKVNRNEKFPFELEDDSIWSHCEPVSTEDIYKDK